MLPSRSSARPFLRVCLGFEPGAPVAFPLHFTAVLFLVTLSCPVEPVVAQSVAARNRGTVTDVYGNARLQRRGRYPEGLVQGLSVTPRHWMTPAAARGFGPLGAMHGGPQSNSLLERYVSGSRTNQVRRSQAPRPMSPYNPQVYSTYGGFGDRRRSPIPGDVMQAMARRQMLIGASTGNAPIYRANLTRASVAGVRSAVDQTPFAPGASSTAPEMGETLSETLERSLSTTRDALREEAWDAFAEGDYRRAVRALETVVRFEPDNYEARFGELFAHAALGSERTVAVLSRGMARTDPNIFAHEFDPASRFGDRKDLTNIRVLARTRAEASEADADLTASAALLLWYLGDREEALSAAVRVARLPDGETYREWPARMRAAVPSPR